MSDRKYTIAVSRSSGKAVKGTNRTSTIQVRDYTAFANGDYLLVKQFRYNPAKEGDRDRALAAAQEYINGIITPV